MAQLFGKNYQEAGSSSSPLLLRSNGEIKLQWGNKFIDLIKNGKINSESKDYIFTVDTSDEIKANGIYLVTEDNSIWINVNDTKTQLSITDTTYVSFLTEQKTTSEQKQQALTNLGLIYENMDALNKAGLITGLAYVVESSKLYLIKDKTITEYQVTSTLPTSGKFDDLTISNLTIKNNTIDSNQLSFTIGKTQYLQLKNSQVVCSMPLLLDTIQSSNYAYNSSGFSLQYKQGKSSLDVDSINWRNIESELPKNQKEYIEYTIIGEYNIVTSAWKANSVDSNDTYQLNLKYPNTLNVNDFIEAEVNTTYNVYLIKEEIKKARQEKEVETETGTETITEVINQTWFYLNKDLPEGFILKVVLNDNSIAYYGSEATNEILKLESSNNIESKHVVSAQLVTKKEEATYIPSTKYFVDVTTSQKHSNKPLECKIVEINDKYITVQPLDQEAGSDIIASSQFKIYQARISQFIQGEGYLALRKWDSENNKYVYHTIMGTYKESEFGISDDTSDKFGLYSDDIKVTGISLSGAQFSGKLPSFTEVKPNTIADNEFPTMEIVNEKIKKAVDDVGDTNLALVNKNSLPKGSIIMFNNAKNIPDKWQICDGTNGTPNLIDKFIKAGTALKEESVELTKYTDSTETPSGQTEDNKYKLDAYSLIFIMKMK